MLRVEIYAPSDSWVDHSGSPIEKLVFSKAYSASYTPGYYPLEEAGSLYRNIDDFRASPLQSRTDWEIKIPSIYSGGGAQTIDLLYQIESETEDNGGEFDLVGCEAILYDDEDIIYSGVVESVSNSTGTSSIRISDWLGNPKSAKRQFPVAVGNSELSRWQVKVTREKGVVRLEISDRPLKNKPSFFIKLGEDEWITILTFQDRIIYSEGFKTGTIIRHAPSSLYTYPLPISKQENLLLPVNANYILRPDPSKETPDFYAIGEGDDLEILEVWSNGTWTDDIDNVGNINELVFSVGRDILRKRRSHKPPVHFFYLEDANAMLTADAHFYPESILMESPLLWDNPPFQKGNPSQLYWNSRNPFHINFDGCPVIAGSSEFLYLRGIRFNINLTVPKMPSGTKIIGFRLSLAMLYEDINTLFSYFRINGTTFYLPGSMTGDIQHFYLDGFSEKDFFTSLKIEFSFSSQNPDFSVVVGYIHAFCIVGIPLDDNKLYASAEFADSNDSLSEPESAGVKPILRGLLKMTGLEESNLSGESNRLLYGGILSSDAFALRDKLRSLAAESATLLTLNPASSEIKVKDISLQKNVHKAFLPLDAFLLDGNICHFKMESADRSDLLSEVSVFWGKDFETGKYAHVFRAYIYGRQRDGERYDNFDFIPESKWLPVFLRMAKNTALGIGINKTVESEWITNWEAAENMAYNLLRWNTTPMRKALAKFIFTELNKIVDDVGDAIDIGSFVHFALPGYPPKMSETLWMVTGRHDDLDGYVSTLELLEVPGQAEAEQNERNLLLEDGTNVLLENNTPIKLEDS